MWGVEQNEPKILAPFPHSISTPVSVKAGLMEGWGGQDLILRKRYLLSLEWKRVGVMDNDSGDDGTDELRQFG